MNLKLVKPSMELKKQHLDFIKEWYDYEEDITPFSTRLLDKTYERWLDDTYKLEKKETAPVDWVPATTYFMIDHNKRILGAVNIRHELNDFLLNYGGHIGYGIRPTERRKGYATKLLEMALQIANADVQSERILVTCDKNNIASSKTIKKNGGILENEVLEDGKLVQRYWIEL